MTSFTIRLAALLLALFVPLPLHGQQVASKQPEPAASEAVTSPYVRVRDSADGNHTVLQVAIRSFHTPEMPAQPVVHLVGVTHIGDKKYYTSLQEFLDQQDIVLFEGVKPAEAAPDLDKADDASRVKMTKSRQRLLAVVVSRFKAKNGQLPKSFDEALAPLHGSMARLGQAATLDGWGRPQTYVILPAQEGKQPKFDIVSLGADNVEGGDGAAADLRFSAQKPLTKEEKSGGEGIQLQLARALGLEFQLVAIDYNRPRWRNSDMTMDELQQKLEEAGASGGMLFSMLDGSSVLSKLMGAVLGMIESSPEMSFYVKVMVVETLGRADEMMEVQASTNKGMGKMMKVLIEERNRVVFEDLERLIRDEPHVRSVALFYGAGHLPDMEERLAAMGYRETGVEWKDAVAIDSGAVAGGKGIIRQVRRQVAGMVPKKKDPQPAKPGEAAPAEPADEE